MKKIEGKITAIEDAKVLKSGTKKNGKPYTLYGVTAYIDEAGYTMTGFSQKELDEFVHQFRVGESVEADLEQNGEYLNLVAMRLMRASAQPTAKAPEAPKAAPAPLKLDVAIPSLPSLTDMASIADLAVKELNIDEEFNATAKLQVFLKVLECEYAWRTSRYIQASKEGNMKRFEERGK
jgi:hypothetical protein